MLDKFLVLLERFVVAHELIAANSGNKKTSVGELTVDLTTTIAETAGKALSKAMKDVPVEGEDVIDTKPAKKAEPVEDDLADDEPEEKPKTRKPRQAKKAEPEVDMQKIKDELVEMAQHIGSGPSDDADNEFQDLLDEYDVRSVKKLPEDQVVKFHTELKAIVAKYYDIEE